VQPKRISVLFVLFWGAGGKLESNRKHKQANSNTIRNLKNL